MPTSDFFLLPTTLQYAKFEKVGMKNANLATLVDSARKWCSWKEIMKDCIKCAVIGRRGIRLNVITNFYVLLSVIGWKIRTTFFIIIINFGFTRFFLFGFIVVSYSFYNSVFSYWAVFPSGTFRFLVSRSPSLNCNNKSNNNKIENSHGLMSYPWNILLASL